LKSNAEISLGLSDIGRWKRGSRNGGNIGLLWALWW